MILVIVYVGAVAVLFLFVVMMLDVDFAELRQGFLQNLPIGLLVGIVFLIELIAVITSYFVDPALIRTPAAAASGTVAITNTEAIGQVLYTRYFYFFQAAGLILLVAMIGAIVLTLRERLGVKRQDISKQNARTPDEAIEVRKVPFRQGV
jgi:NADH-quinone oxidoreductase subunit J